MGYVKNLFMEAEGWDRESQTRAKAKTSLNSRVTEILMGNGFDKDQAASVAASLIESDGMRAIDQARQLTP